MRVRAAWLTERGGRAFCRFERGFAATIRADLSARGENRQVELTHWQR